MPRPRKRRVVCGLPAIREFGPIPRPDGEREAVVLSVDELETLRLIDKEGLTQEECGEQMQVARTTVQLAYDQARRKVAEALVNGLPLIIQGGDYRLCDGQKRYCGRGGRCEQRLAAAVAAQEAANTFPST